MSFLFIKFISSIITLAVKLHITTKNMTSQIKMNQNAIQISWLNLLIPIKNININMLISIILV